MSDQGVNGEDGQGAEGAGSQLPAGEGAGTAGSEASASTQAQKRKIRTPEEILKDIEKEEQDAINKIKERAAQRKAEVKKKTSASNRKNVATEILDKHRNAVRLALNDDKMDDAVADEHLGKIMDAGVAALANSLRLAA